VRVFVFLKEELLKNIKIFILLFLECLFTFLISGFCMSFLLDSYASLKAINNMNKTENWYYLIKNSDYNKSNTGNYMENEWDEFYHYIIDNYDYIMSTGELISIEDTFIWQNGEAENAIGISYFTENYFEYLNPEKIIDYDWNSYNGDYIPVILGYDYKLYYQVGDVINSRWEVVAFCKDGWSIPIGNSYQLVHSGSGGVITLMKYYSSDNFDRSSTEVCVYSESEDDLIPIFKKFSELGLDSVVPISFLDRINFMIRQFYKILSSYLFIAIGITVFSILCTSSGFSNYLRLRKRDYLIYEICGANVYGIAINIAILNFTVILLPALVCALIFGRIDLIPIFLIISAVIEICSLAKPLYYLLKKPLIEQYYENR